MTEHHGEPETVKLLLDKGALDELLAGCYVSRIWLRPVVGGYRLCSFETVEPTSEAILRVLCGEPGNEHLRDVDPPPPAPSDEVAALMVRCRDLIDELD